MFRVLALPVPRTRSSLRSRDGRCRFLWARDGRHPARRILSPPDGLGRRRRPGAGRGLLGHLPRRHRAELLPLFFRRTPEDSPRPKRGLPGGPERDRRDDPALSEQARFGTQGWVYPSWRGVFYPAGLDPKRELSHYATKFDAVEVDSSFYAIPPRRNLERWREVTPPGFVLALKFPQSITHEKGLAGAEAETEAFVERARLLGDRLGPLLLQFRPGFKAEKADDLARFLERLPRDLAVAAEFRHRSWYREETYSLLRERGVALTLTDHASAPPVDVATAPFVYVRLLGSHDAPWEDFSEVRVDRGDDLRGWAERLRTQLAAGRKLFVFANNHYQGHSPATARALRGLLGIAEPNLPFVEPRREEGGHGPSLFGEA
ncbi:MAG TPA: DUF72 domain-containing protein [Planctomycetota bacterium]|nr:DUF72 domain-containing protein [Planctomycetota bacterium]